MWLNLYGCDCEAVRHKLKNSLKMHFLAPKMVFLDSFNGILVLKRYLCPLELTFNDFQALRMQCIVNIYV